MESAFQPWITEEIGRATLLRTRVVRMINNTNE
jgi:hypothetical protein